MVASSSSFRSLHCLVVLLLRSCFCATMKKSSAFQSRSEPRIPKTRQGISKRTFLKHSWTYLKSILSCGMKRRPSLKKDDHQTFSSLTRATNLNTTTAPGRRNSGSSNEFRRIAQRSASVSSLRTNTYPCTMCGEVFSKTHFLDHHQTIKHAVSELTGGDSGRNVVEIIFQTGWLKIGRHPQILRIIKIHNSPKILKKFEEYRGIVKARASRTGSRRHQRCLVDGNELLRFYCSAFSCSLGHGGNSSLCNQQFCSICGIIRYGFSSKLDGICTYSSSDKAHESMAEDIEEEFSFMNAKRAILICRVIAGRIAYDQQLGLKESYDSIAGESGDYPSLEELYVFSPRAILPCFAIMYNV